MKKENQHFPQMTIIWHKIRHFQTTKTIWCQNKITNVSNGLLVHDVLDISKSTSTYCWSHLLTNSGNLVAHLIHAFEWLVRSEEITWVRSDIILFLYNIFLYTWITWTDIALALISRPITNWYIGDLFPFENKLMFKTKLYRNTSFINI